MSLPIECPEPGQPIIFPSGPWVDAMAACMQDPLHHGEGDVWTHTKLVCEALVARPEWARLSPEARWVTWVACLLHDVAKPETRRVEDGVVRHPRHSARGARRSSRKKTRSFRWSSSRWPGPASSPDPSTPPS